jgi:hypothetical protein
MSIEVREGPSRAGCGSPLLHRAGAEDGGERKTGRSVRILFPIDPEAFFVREDAFRRKTV